MDMGRLGRVGDYRVEGHTGDIVHVNSSSLETQGTHQCVLIWQWGENMRGFLKKLTVDVDRKRVGIGLLDKELLHSWSPKR